MSLGVGAGIGAIFGAPLGGAVLAASIIYRDDFEYRTLYPGFVTSATAYAVFGSFLGFDPMFGYVDAEYRFEDAWPLLWFVVLGIAAATVGYLYARIFYATGRLTARLPGGRGGQTYGGRFAGGPAGVGAAAGSGQRVRLGAAGHRQRFADSYSAVDSVGSAAREDRCDVAVDRHGRIGWHFWARHRDRGVRRRRNMAGG